MVSSLLLLAERFLRLQKIYRRSNSDRDGKEMSNIYWSDQDTVMDSLALETFLT